MTEQDRLYVRDAARFMDRIKPDWFLNVKPLELDLSQCSACVCGQNGMDWKEVATWRYGPPPSTFMMVTASREFEPLWLEEVAARMPLKTANYEQLEEAMLV